MRVGSDVYKVVTGKRDIIFRALYKAVLDTRKRLAEAKRRLEAAEIYTASGKKRNDRLYIEALEERLEHYSNLRTILCRTHWRRLLATDFQDWIEDLLEQVLGWRYPNEGFIPKGSQLPADIDYDAWDKTWVEVRKFIRLLFANSIQAARSLEVAAWQLSPDPAKRLLPLEYRPQISPNAPAL